MSRTAYSLVDMMENVCGLVEVGEEREGVHGEGGGLLISIRRSANQSRIPAAQGYITTAS